MEREVKVGETKARMISLTCGVLLFCANLIIFVAAQIATENHQNMAVVTAIANGTIPLGLLGSYFIYKERLALWQILGSLCCLTGILILSLSVLGKKETHVGAVLIAADVAEKEHTALRNMVIDAFIAMFMLGTKINCAKYCTKIISSLSFFKYNMVMDFLCGVFIIIMSAVSIIEIPLSLYVEAETLRSGFLIGTSCALAEIFVTLALNEGPTGPVTAVISFNAPIVSVLIWVIQGIALTTLQIVGILLAFIGIIVVSLSNQPADSSSSGTNTRMMARQSK